MTRETPERPDNIDALAHHACGHTPQSQMARYALSLEAQLAEAGERVDRLESTIDDIREFAHYQSTGPAVPDGYWLIRDMASRVDEDSEQTRDRVKREVMSEIAFLNACNGANND